MKKTQILFYYLKNLHSRGNVLDEFPSTVKYAQPRRPLLQIKSILRIFSARNEAVKYTFQLHIFSMLGVLIILLCERISVY
jgi:hypothetical protein